MAQQQAPLREQALKVISDGKDFLEKTAGELPVIHTYEQNLIDILGEEVALTPTGINKSFKQIIEFDDYYKPKGISEEDAVILKNTMRILFDNSYKKVLDVESGEEDGSYTLKTFPPCDEKQKELVLQSLIYRKNRLLGQLQQLGIKPYEDIRKNLRRLNEKDKELQGKETLTARQYLVHFYKLQKFINDYNTHTLCTSTDDKAFKGIKVDLDDDKIRELLKQYVFFILQGQHPLEAFKKTDPTSSQFIARLAKKPLGEQFPTFMKKYKEQKFPIPEPIVRILESTDLAPGAMKAAIDQEVLVQTQEIIKYIKTILPSTHPFYKRFPKLEQEKDLQAILDELLKLLKDCEVNGQLLQKEKTDLEIRIKTLTQARDAAEKKMRDIEAIFNLQQGKEAEMEQLKKNVEELRVEKDKVVGELTGQITAARQQKDAITAQINAQKTADDATIARLEQENTAATATIVDLRQEVQQLQQLHQTDVTGLDTLRKQLAQATAQRDQSDAARIAAEEAAKKAAEDAQTRIVAKQTELDQAQAAAAAATTSMADLQRQLNEATSLLQTKEQEILAAKKETEKAQTDFTQGKKSEEQLKQEITRLQQQLQDTTEGLSEVQELQQELQEVQRQNADLQSQVKACKENEAKFTTNVNALKNKIDELTKNVQTKQEELNALAEKVQGLTTVINDQREQLKVQQTDAIQREKEHQRSQQAMRDSLESERKKAADAVAQQNKLKDMYDASIEEEKNKYDASLKEFKEEYDVEIKAAHENLDAAVAKQAEENRVYRDKLDQVVAQKDAALAKQTEEIRKRDQIVQQKDAELAQIKQQRNAAVAQKDAELGQIKQERDAAVALSKEKQALEQAVLAIASGQTDIPQVSEQQTQSALVSILQKLKTPLKSTDPLAALKEQKKESSSSMQCYYVFLLSFLWQNNFPTLMTEEAKSSKNLLQNTLYSHPEEFFIYKFFYSIFRQGPDPSVKGRDLGDPHDGLLNTLTREMKNKDTVTKVFKNPVDVMREYFSIIQLLSKILMTPYFDDTTIPVQLSPIQLICLKKLIEQVEYLNGIYAAELNASKQWVQNLEEDRQSSTTASSSSQRESVTISSFTESFLKRRQPKLDTDFFNRRIVIEGDSVNIGTTGNISYPVLFYCFLMLLRDYLNTIENTDKACRLPTFLQIKK